jgi:hypothetical protein
MAGVTASLHSCWCCFSIAIHGLFQPRELRPDCCLSGFVFQHRGSLHCVSASELSDSSCSASSTSNHAAASCFGICILGLCSSSVFQHVRPRVCVVAPVFQHRLCNNFCVSASVLNAVLQIWTLMRF